MYLIIDMSVNNVVTLRLFEGKNVVTKDYEGRNKILLESLVDFLKREKKEAQDIKGIAVVVGAGSFTSTRIATVVANAFGFAKNIPLVSIEEKDKENYSLVKEKLQKQKKGVYISAKYSGKPNIN